MGSLRAQLVGDGHQQSGRRAAIVGAHIIDISEPVVGLVVRGQHNYAVLLSGKAHDEVAHSHRANGRRCGERILFELVVAEMVVQKFLGLSVPWAGGPARPDSHKLPRILERCSPVEVLLGRSGERSERHNQQRQPRCNLLPKRKETHCADSFFLRRDG